MSVSKLSDKCQTNNSLDRESLHTFAVEKWQTYDTTKNIFETQHMRGVACLCHCRHRVWYDCGADSKFVGLSGVYYEWLQIRDRSSAWGTRLYVGCQPLCAICKRYVACGLDGQSPLCTPECGLYLLPVSHHHAPCKETDLPSRRRNDDSTSHHDSVVWRRGGIDLYLQRYLLVLSCRG